MIGFVGLSHLGLNYSLATAAKGFDVVAFDPDPGLVSRCAAGNFPIEEPGFSDLFLKHGGRLRYTADAGELSGCDLVFISLDVATDDRNESDLDPLRDLIHRTIPHLSPETTLVVLSQVTPGFTRQLAAGLVGQSKFGIYYQVETLIFGRAVERAMNPERYIVGAADPAKPLPMAFQAWHAVFGCPVLTMRYESAELAKIAINFFLVSTVATTNTLAEVCEAIGADWDEIAPALRLDRRIGPHAYLKPGLGIAGGNLERDLVTVQALASRYGTDAGIVSAWQRNSVYRRDWALRILHREVLSRLPHPPRIAVWGLAYKENTHSIKNSPSVEMLHALRGFDIHAYDPAARIDPGAIPTFIRDVNALESLEDVDVLLVMTPWKEFSSISCEEISKRMRGRIVIDPYGLLDEQACVAAGLQCFRLGKSAGSGRGAC